LREEPRKSAVAHQGILSSSSNVFSIHSLYVSALNGEKSFYADFLKKNKKNNKKGRKERKKKKNDYCKISCPT
jgi:hypothetical protein